MGGEKRVKAKDLHPTIVKFCAGYRVYLLKEISQDNWEIERGNGSSNGKEKINSVFKSDSVGMNDEGGICM